MPVRKQNLPTESEILLFVVINNRFWAASKALDTQAYLIFLSLFVIQNEKARDISLSSSGNLSVTL